MSTPCSPVGEEALLNNSRCARAPSNAPKQHMLLPLFRSPTRRYMFVPVTAHARPTKQRRMFVVCFTYNTSVLIGHSVFFISCIYFFLPPFTKYSTTALNCRVEYSPPPRMLSCVVVTTNDSYASSLYNLQKARAIHSTRAQARAPCPSR